MLTDLYARRGLIRAFAQRDFATRYRSSVIGWGWSLLQPLAMLVIFGAVFTLVFRVQAPLLGNGSGNASYVAFLFTGIVTWNLFSSTLTLSMSQLKSNGELLKKVQFPAWAPILGASVVQLMQVVLELIVLIVMFVWLRNVGWTWILAIPVLIGMYLFAQGVGLVLSILNARFGDVAYIIGVALSALYFITPVLYPLSLVEEHGSWLAWVVKVNPVSWYVQAMHDVMYSLTSPVWWELVALLVGGFVVFWAGFAIFERTSEDIGELL